jgi:hypothetical protein
MKSLVDANDVWLGQTTFKSRVQIKRSITLDLLVRSCINFYRSLRTMFPCIDKIFILDADDFLSNQTTDQTRVPAQKVYNS